MPCQELLGSGSSLSHPLLPQGCEHCAAHGELCNHLLHKKTILVLHSFLSAGAFNHQWYFKQNTEQNGSSLISACSSCSHAHWALSLTHSFCICPTVPRALISAVFPAWEVLEGCLILGSWAHKGAGSPSCPQCSLGEEGREMGVLTVACRRSGDIWSKNQNGKLTGLRLSVAS